MTTRVLIKVLFVLVASIVVAIGGHRAVRGRWPSPATAAVLTIVVFAAVVVLDAAYGW